MTTNASSRVTSNFPPITSSSSSASSSNALRCNTNHLQFKNHYNVTTPLPPTPGPSLHSLPHTTTSLLHPHYKSDTATTAESTMQLASPTTSECSISSTHSNEKKEENEFLSSFAVNSIQENEMNVDVEMSKNSFNVMDTSLKTMSMSTTQLSLTSSDLIDSKLDVRALSSFTTYQSSDAQNNQEKMVMKEENDLMMTMEDEDDMVIHLDFMDGTPSLPTPSISSLPSSSHITSATTTTNTSKFNTLHGIHAILSNDPEEEAMRMNEDDIDVLPPPPLLTNPMKFIEKLSGSSSCFYDPVHHDRDPSSTSSTHHLPPSYDPTSSFLESPPSNFTTTPSSTSMAFHSPPTGNCVDDSEVLLIAAHALNGLKEGFQQEPHPSTHSPTSTFLSNGIEGTLESSTTSNMQRPCVVPSDRFISRVASIPIVNSGIRSLSNFYEQTKAHSQVVQYSAEVLEKNLKPISEMAGKYLRAPMREVDNFACRQLDRLESRYTSFRATDSTPPTVAPMFQSHHPSPSTSSSISSWRSTSPGSSSNTSNFHLTTESPVPPSSPISEPSFPSLPSTSSPSETYTSFYKAKWQQVTAGAVAAAGAGAAVVSEESMKSLRYCLEWLHYASNQIEEQIQKLRHFTSVTVYSNMTSKEVAIHRPDWLPDLNTIRKNIAEILRKVVDVVGRYASGFLNTDARNSVRSFILSLPARWASLNTNPASSEANEAHRIMAFASDTSSILRSMQDIFSQALSTAEHWLGTLHRVPFVNSLVPPSRFATATTTTTTTTTTTSTLPGSPFSSPYMDESPENMIGLTPSYYSSTLPPPPPVFSPQSTPSSLLLQPTSSPDWLPSFDTLPVPALTNTHPSAGLRKRPNQTSSVSDSSTVTPIKQEPSSNVSNPVKTNSSKKRRK